MMSADRTMITLIVPLAVSFRVSCAVASKQAGASGFRIVGRETGNPGPFNPSRNGSTSGDSEAQTCSVCVQPKDGLSH